VHTAELMLGLLIAVAVLVTVARRFVIPYPIFLAVGGLVLGLVPGVPRVAIDPDVVFLVVLPPLLYVTAFFTPVRGFRANLGTISSLAVLLVIASALVVAAAARLLIPDMTWPVALALGAIVAPPDAVAATAVAARLAVPRRIVTLLEGESLLNDATALTLYALALKMALGGAVGPKTAVTAFTGAMLGGAAIGVAVGWLIAQIRSRLQDTPVEITISLLTPYVAFLPAHRLGASGVIATVTAGLYLGYRGSHIMGADARLTGRAVWETLTFLLNGFVFIVMGLEVPVLFHALPPSSAIRVVVVGIAVSLILVAVRTLFVFATLWAPAALRSWPEARSLAADAIVLSWAGMRGVVSLAAALALPTVLAAGAPLPVRETLIIVTVTVIGFTLVGQGLSLPLIIRRLHLAGDAGARAEEVAARQRLLEAAARRLDELDPVWPGHRPLLDQLRETYRHRSEHVDRQREAGPADVEDRELIEHREIRRTVIDAEREALLRLRAEGAIDDDVLRKLQHELDLEERRMDA
jgi:monovalent cation/hydrogen antiporter